MTDADTETTSDDPNPYMAPDSASSNYLNNANTANRRTFALYVTFLIPAIASLVLAFPCADYFYTVRNPIRSYYFAFGGNALTLVVCWLIARPISRWLRLRSTDDGNAFSTTVGIAYGISGGICWLLAATGVVGWP